MTATVCPTHQQLTNYSLGCLAEPSCHEVEMHLDTCKSCDQTLISLEGSVCDVLISDLRSLSSEESFAHEPEMVQALGLAQKVVLASEGDSTGVRTDTSAESSTDRDENVPEFIRDYRLLEKIGEGGMGTVYRALHTQLGKPVAMKLIPMAKGASADAVARFRRETLAHGQLDHPNLVRATDAGCEGDRRFLVMDLVEGLDLYQIVRRTGPLSLADACEIIRQAAIGLAHAHSKEVIHRDVKPSNIMLSTEGRVKILDLGLAKQRSLAVDELTSHGQIMGTLDYMSPEQGGDTRRVDYRADVYSLGCTLYFLLADEPPYRLCGNDSPAAKLLSHAQQPVPSIRALRPEIPAEFDALLQRMLAKAPVERTGSAAEVAEGLARFAIGHNLPALVARAGNSDPEKTVSMPAHSTTVCSRTNVEDTDRDVRLRQSASSTRPTMSEPAQVGNADWRRPGIGRAVSLGAAGLALVAFGLIIVTTGDGTLELTVQEKNVTVKLDGKDINVDIGGTSPAQIRVPAGAHELEVVRGDERLFTQEFRLFRNGTEVVVAKWRTVNAPVGAKGVEQNRAAVVDAAVPRVEVGAADEALALRLSTGSTALVSHPVKLDGVGAWTVETRNLRGHLGDLAYSPDGKYLAAYSHDGAVRVWETDGYKLVNVLVGHSAFHDMQGAGQIAWSPDSRFIAVSSGSSDSNLRVWEVASGNCVRVLPLDIRPRGVAWSPDGKVLAVGGVGDAYTVQLYETTAWTVTKSWPAGGWIQRLAWSPDSSRLAAGYYGQGRAVLWDVRTGEARAIDVHDFARGGSCFSVAFSPDGSALAATSDVDHSVSLIDVATGAVTRTHKTSGDVFGVAWLQSKDALAICGSNLAETLDPTTLEPTARWSADVQNAVAISISPLTGEIAIGSDLGFLRIVDMATGKVVHTLSERFATVTAANWSPDGNLLATSDANAYRDTQPARVWDIRQKKVVSRTHLIKSQTNFLEFLDGNAQLLSLDEGALTVWDLANRQPTTTIPFDRELAYCAAVSPDRSRVATGGDSSDRRIRMWDIKTGRMLYELEPYETAIASIAWSPDGQFIAYFNFNTPGLVVVRAVDGAKVKQFTAKDVNVPQSVAWSVDSRQLAVGSASHIVTAFDVATWSAIDRCEVENRAIGLKWLEDGATLRIVEENIRQFARMYDWNPSTGELRQCASRPVELGNRSIARDGGYTASYGFSDIIYLWDFTSGQRTGVLAMLTDNSTHWIAPNGQIESSTREAAEAGFVYVLRTTDGAEILAPSEFVRRYGNQAFSSKDEPK